MLVFNQADKEAFKWGSAFGMIEDSWFWLLVWAIIAGAGMGYQLMSVATVKLPEDRWTRAQPAPAV
jgi:hypothetical protein